MKSVFIISSGCIYEGGGVDAVLLRRDLAEAKFQALVEEKRESNRKSEEYERGRILGGQKRWKEDGYWLQEKVENTECKALRWKETCIIFLSDYIYLREYECEE